MKTKLFFLSALLLALLGVCGCINDETVKRKLSIINYHIHTDAIKSLLIPEEIASVQVSIIYAEEADVLNVAIFGTIAKQWREANPDLKDYV